MHRSRLIRIPSAPSFPFLHLVFFLWFFLSFSSSEPSLLQNRFLRGRRIQGRGMQGRKKEREGPCLFSILVSSVSIPGYSKISSSSSSSSFSVHIIFSFYAFVLSSLFFPSSSSSPLHIIIFTHNCLLVLSSFSPYFLLLEVLELQD